MNKITVYHGSSDIIDNPMLGAGKTYNDYGQGFYCTENEELAKEWGTHENSDGYANCYEIDLDGLKVLRLTDEKYTILNWLAILLDNRIVRMSTPIEKRGRDYILKHFLPDYTEYDVIIGYRADDSYFSFARAFVGNGISLGQLEKAMKLGKLGEQIVLTSEKAFGRIRFVSYANADNEVYYSRRKARDDQARDEYLKMLEIEDIDGIYIRDIVREEMKSDDEKLQ